jgi:N-acyl-D-aspartate/D-glutamate deacylase
MNQAKEMVGLRINPDLKEVLEAEAKERDLSFSAYLEKLLLNRRSDAADTEHMKARLFELEAMVSAQAHQMRLDDSLDQAMDVSSIEQLQEETIAKEVENRKLKQEKVELLEQVKRVLAERNAVMGIQQRVIPHWINNANYNFMMQMLERLRQKHPQYTHEELLLSSIRLVEYNHSEPIFILSRLDGLWKEEPKFIHQLKQKGGQQ